MLMLDDPLSWIRVTQVAMAVQCVFYGAYLVLFGISVNILVKRKKGRYLLATVVLFVLASANMVLWAIDDIGSICDINCWKSPVRLQDALYETTLASSAIADAILLWRCYTVWGRQFKIVILPVLLYLVTHVLGLVMSSSDVMKGGVLLIRAATMAGVIALNNLLLSILIAYRIFRISRGVVAHLGARARNMYRTIICATLESGLLYFAFLIVFFLAVPGGKLQMAYICNHIWGPIAGIVPTVVIVRVALGISFDNVESAIISIRATITRDEEDVPPVVDISRQMISRTAE